ncbi:MAG: hypothetical protein HKN35_15800 [Woeseia sp.]|nr:hypothetical protein [Woeseia sp.]
MVEIKVDPTSLAALKSAIRGTNKQLPKEMANAVNKTATKTRTRVSKEIRKELNVSSKGIKKFLRIKGRATSRNPTSAVMLDHEKRPGVGGPTKRFSPDQKAKGTSWKISKRERKAVRPGTFMGPRPGRLAPKLHGGVFVRRGAGRQPIVKIHGLSPWAAYLKNDMDPIIRQWSQEELQEQIASRVRTILKQKLRS